MALRLRPNATEARRLPDDQRARLRALLDAVPTDPDANDPAVMRVLDYGLTLKVPWWGPTSGAGLGYMIRLYSIDVALDALRRLADCDDWGTGPHGEEGA